MGFFFIPSHHMDSYKTYTVEEARRKLEHYCSYQDRCHDEVVKKLKGMKMIPQAVDVIVNHLIQNNFLNEERFACSFARGKHRIKHWGKTRIISELKARGISKYNIDRAMKEIDPNEYLEVFHTLAEKQWESTNERSLPKKKAKVMGYLMRKGFESHLVYEKLSELSANN